MHIGYPVCHVHRNTRADEEAARPSTSARHRTDYAKSKTSTQRAGHAAPRAGPVPAGSSGAHLLRHGEAGRQLSHGRQPESHPDTEQTLEELQQRVRATLSWLEGFKPADFAGAAAVKVSQPRWKGEWMTGADYLVQHALPNFYFHITTSYAILRHNGVSVGKRDFLGRRRSTRLLTWPGQGAAEGRRRFVSARAVRHHRWCAGPDESLAAPRADFQRALTLMSATPSVPANDSAELRRYVLYPYLEAARLERSLRAAGNSVPEALDEQVRHSRGPMRANRSCRICAGAGLRHWQPARAGNSSSPFMTKPMMAPRCAATASLDASSW